MLLWVYLEAEEPDLEVLKKCIRKGTLSSSFVPVYVALPLRTSDVNARRCNRFFLLSEDLPPVRYQSSR